MTLTDQLRAILKKAGAPMSLNQLMDVLPVGTERNTVNSLLCQRKQAGEFTRCVEYGKAAYAWAGDDVSDVHVAPVAKISKTTACGLDDSMATHVPLEVAKCIWKPADATVGKPALPPLTALLEEVGDSAARVADALYEAIQACASKTLMAKLAIAHKALHEAHVELLGATAGG